MYKASATETLVLQVTWCKTHILWQLI